MSQSTLSTTPSRHFRLRMAAVLYFGARLSLLALLVAAPLAYWRMGITDWRLGAAWFESQLIDYDVYSNQGNWLYLAGLGTDPRGGRRFNIAKQEQDHDPRGEYQRLWL